MFIISKVNKIVFLKIVSFLSPQLFNFLPLEIQNNNSSITFIGRLKEFSLFQLGDIDPLFIVSIFILSTRFFKEEILKLNGVFYFICSLPRWKEE